MTRSEALRLAADCEERWPKEAPYKLYVLKLKMPEKLYAIRLPNGGINFYRTPGELDAIHHNGLVYEFRCIGSFEFKAKTSK